MGCFLACFGSSKSKRRKHRHSVQWNATIKPKQPSGSPLQDHYNVPLNTEPELQDNKTEEQLSVSSRKKVTFDSNVRTYEPVLQDEVADSNKGEKEEGEGGKDEESLAKPGQSKSSSSEGSSEDSSVISTGSYPSNHRYQNCRDSDDEEDEGMDYGASDLSDEEDEGCELGEDFDDDRILYSREKIDVENVVTEEVESSNQNCEKDGKPIGSNLNARDRSAYVHPVLNPVENLSQWKALKSKRTLPLTPQKENYVSPNHELRISNASERSAKELSFSLNPETDIPPKKPNQDIPVDASLSNWLVSSERGTPVSKVGSAALCSGTPERSTGCTASPGSNSMMSHEDRPILGALTLEELKKFSVTSASPRKSPTRSPDEMPIIGTVGSYWNFSGSGEDSGSVSSFKGIPNTTSKYREDKRVNWHSTPFETRLEKAMNRGAAAEAASSYVPKVF